MILAVIPVSRNLSNTPRTLANKFSNIKKFAHPLIGPFNQSQSKQKSFLYWAYNQSYCYTHLNIKYLHHHCMHHAPISHHQAFWISTHFMNILLCYDNSICKYFLFFASWWFFHRYLQKIPSSYYNSLTSLQHMKLRYHSLWR